jgi:hypothetical protein
MEEKKQHASKDKEPGELSDAVYIEETESEAPSDISLKSPRGRPRIPEKWM